MSNKHKLKLKHKTSSIIDSDEESEHELFYYANNRVKLMKEVLKLIKPKKIKSIAPDFIKNLDIEEINSMLLEELLGISNKRLKHIINGESVDVESSSTDSEDEQKPVDIISLDDISDTDDEFGLGSFNTNDKSETSKKYKQKQQDKKTRQDKKKCKVPKPIKQEKLETVSKKKKVNTSKANKDSEKDKLMSVLEILELQARARAIRSQLALENANKQRNKQSADITIKDEDSGDSDALIVDTPKNDEIVITSSDSEHEFHKSEESKTTGVSMSKSTSSSLNNTQKGSDKLCGKRKNTCNRDITPAADVEMDKDTDDSVKAIETKISDALESNGDSSVIVDSGDNEKIKKHYALSSSSPKVDSNKHNISKSDSENDDVINLDVVDLEDMEND